MTPLPSTLDPGSSYLWATTASKPPSGERCESPFNLDDHWKPGGGLWTSKETEPGTSGWTAYCNSEHYRTRDRRIWRLRNRPARILEVADLASARRIAARYPFHYPDRVVERVNWPAIAIDYDAIHVTGKAIHDPRLPLPFRCWSCDTTFWFRWCFDVKPELIAAPQRFRAQLNPPLSPNRPPETEQFYVRSLEF